MKWFYNMKIGRKLLIGFILVALIAGIVGVIGMVNLQNSRTGYAAVYQDYGVALGDLGEIATTYQQLRVTIRDFVIDGLQNKDKYTTRYQDLQKTMSANFDVFEKTINSDEAMASFNELKKEYGNLIPLLDKVISNIFANQPQEAMRVMRGDALAAANNIERLIKELDTKKTNDGKTESTNIENSINTAMILMLIIIFAGMVLAVILGVIIARMISRPVGKLVGVAEKIQDGDLNVEVDIRSEDEIGVLANTFRKMVANLNDVMTNISLASEQVSSGSRQVSDSSIALSQGATEQASTIEQLTASLEEISAQTKLNASSANEANNIAETAKSSAVDGNNQMKDMLKAMEEINNSSSNISKIIKVIDEIAFQTNILALNAAVEAARAGQHGKGFAVVAEEVRNLAARSANAAKETTAMIEGSIKKVEGGTKIANQTADALTRIVEDVAKVANLVNNIAIASNEQATGIAQINQGIIQVSQVVQTNSATSEESAAASEELASQSELLKEQVARFKIKKTNRMTAYRDFDDFGDDTHNQISTHIEKKKSANGKDGKTDIIQNRKKIVLNDNEFGKY